MCKSINFNGGELLEELTCHIFLMMKNLKVIFPPLKNEFVKWFSSWTKLVIYSFYYININGIFKRIQNKLSDS